MDYNCETPQIVFFHLPSTTFFPKRRHGPIPAFPSFGDGVHQDQNAAHGKAGKVQPLLPQIGPYRQQQPFPSRAASGGRHQQLTGIQVANHQDGEAHGNDLRKMEKGD